MARRGSILQAWRPSAEAGEAQRLMASRVRQENHLTTAIARTCRARRPAAAAQMAPPPAAAAGPAAELRCCCCCCCCCWIAGGRLRLTLTQRSAAPGARTGAPPRPEPAHAAASVSPPQQCCPLLPGKRCCLRDEANQGARRERDGKGRATSTPSPCVRAWFVCACACVRACDGGAVVLRFGQSHQEHEDRAFRSSVVHAPHRCTLVERALGVRRVVHHRPKWGAGAAQRAACRGACAALCLARADAVPPQRMTCRLNHRWAFAHISRSRRVNDNLSGGC